MADGDHLPDLTTVPPEDRDRVWYETYYRPMVGTPQLTTRAVLMGMVLGGVMSLSNLYVGLKTGWGLGVAITACILSYAIWDGFLKLRIARTPMSLLENNCMQSTASSAGYSTGGTLISAIGAYLIITGENIPFGVLFAWMIALAVLGVALAVPMKRQMINHEQLKFPSGVAAAETLRSLHASGEEARAKARALFLALGGGAFIKVMMEGLPALPERFATLKKLAFPLEVPLPVSPNQRSADAFGLALPLDPILMAAGAIVGLRTGASMALGAVLLYGIIGPALDSAGIFPEMQALGAIRVGEPTPANVRAWGLWTGSATMVAAGLTAFGFQWRSIVRAFSGLGALFGRKPVATGVEADMEAIEVPTSWFIGGTVVSTTAVVFLLHWQWGVAWYWGLVSVFLSFVLSLVACRATGETDITPIGAMGKITQLFYGVVIPGQALPNLMTANVTAGAATSAADLLTDLKSGYLLGANPRQQTLAQAAGIIAGVLVVVPVWYVLVPDPSFLTGESPKYAAPAAAVWASVARLLANGIGSLHPSIPPAMAIGAVLGIVLTTLEQLNPGGLRRYLPSPTGLGLAWVIFFPDSQAFFIGALLALAWSKWSAAKAERYTVPVASGVIAGESLVGVGIALASALPGLISEFMGGS